MDSESSPVTRGYRKFFEIYRVDVDRIPRFDQFVLALKEALIACQESAEKARARPAAPGSHSSDIKTERTRLGISLKALARRSGVSVLTVRGIERGTIKRPQQGTLKKILEALDAESSLPAKG